MPESYAAFVVEKNDAGFSMGVRQRTLDELPAGDVTIRVEYSTINYKDALACSPDGRVVRSYPIVPGVDLAGTVMESSDSRFRSGDKVLVTGFDLGVAHDGGFAQIARVPADWVLKLPNGLSAREAMALGTAGLTAALSIQRMELNGLQPGNGPVLVSGATGGVGSTAVSMLAGLGYQVAGSTGKASEHDFLRGLGATEILSREEVSAPSTRPLEKERWAGCVDPVGGDTLAYMIRSTKYGGSIASSGLTGGTAVATTVFPFILRGVNLLGIESVACPLAVREQLWQRLGAGLKPAGLTDSIAHEISLAEIPGVTAALLKGTVRGRTVVKL